MPHRRRQRCKKSHMQDAKMQEASGNGPDQSPREMYTNRTAVLFSFPKCEFRFCCLQCSFSSMTAPSFALDLSNIYHPEHPHTLNIPCMKTTSVYSFLMYHLLNSLLSHQTMYQMKLQTTSHCTRRFLFHIHHVSCQISEKAENTTHMC